MIRKLLLLLCLFLPTAARAEWREATTRNFIVYSEQSEPQLRAFAAKLERFDRVLRLMHNIDTPPSPNRLRVFLLPDTNAVARMYGAPRSPIAGYYVSDARAMMMVGTYHRATQRRGDLDAQSILLHEYTHHFTYHYFPATYPTWYSEGFAEFWGATRFLDSDVVEIGHPAEHRFASVNPNLGFMNMARWLPVDRLLAAQNYGDVPEVDLLYAEGWLLVRYAWSNPERQRQLQRYLSLINSGRAYADAAREAFGDLRALNNELYSFAGRSRFDVVTVPFRNLEVGEISIRTLGPAEQALIDEEIKLSQGVPQEEFAEFARDLRAEAARFPDDPFALQLLVEVERIARNNDAATAAVDRLLRIQPDHARGLVHKAMLQIDSLRAAGSTDRGAWDAARQLIARANRLRPEDPLPLEALYDSYAAQGVMPPIEAQNALYSAMDLAPSDPDLRYKLARDFEQRNMIREAIAIIRPEAYRVPHREDESRSERRLRERREDRQRRAGTERRETAREMLVRLESRLTQPAASRR
jgi:tetratricopeptide (TPR) repeat protein